MRQITGVTDDQGNVTSVVYDLFGRRTAIGSPDAGLTTFTYDLADNLIANQTANLRASGQQVTFAYQFNRVTAITYPNFPANNVTYTYGAASQRNPSASGNVVGRITHITDRAGTEDRLYGPLGEIVQETRAIPIQGNQIAFYVTNYTFDTWNRMAQMQYPVEVKKLTTDQPNREVVPYFYDFGGLPERVHGNDDALEVDYASAIAYDKFGQRLSMTNGNGVHHFRLQPAEPPRHQHPGDAAGRLHVQQLQLQLRQGRQRHPAAEHRPAARQLHRRQPRQRHRRAGDQDVRL